MDAKKDVLPQTHLIR